MQTILNNAKRLYQLKLNQTLPLYTRYIYNELLNSSAKITAVFGARGVGKTTCARIFAKTINCFNRTDDYEACNECESCSAFNNSGSYNIHELDAASNNTVDDIRSLIEQVRIPPQIGKYSVYIIDEVHMLSQAAFNAFLKTLEEPPEHAIFILATTEKHKIIPTILSRCQVFDFNRIRIEDIVEHLEYIAKSENINYEVEALNIIAQKADGGMRDALSVFDQISSFTENNITYDKVIETLNVLDYDYYFKLTDAFIYNNVSQALLIFDEILNKGFDAGFFINGLSSHFRDMLVAKDEITLQLLEAGQKVKENYKIIAQKTTTDFLYKALDITNECDINYRASKNKRLHVELALIKICNITNTSGEEKKKSELNIAPKESNNTQTGKKLNNTTRDTIIKKNTTSVSSPEKTKNTPVNTINASISIKSALNTNSDNREESDKQEIKRNNSFSEEDIRQALKKYSETIKDSNPHFYVILNNNNLHIKDNQIIIEAISSMQQSGIEANKTNLQDFIRDKLENDNIQVITQTQKTGTQQNEKRLYTDSDKFEYLKAKNADLDILRTEFQLDFD